MMGRVIWGLAILAAAAITTAVQLDRQSRYTPAYAKSVPTPFRAFAQPHVVAQALNAQHVERGLTEAERLVARRPMPAMHLRLLGQAQLAAGETDNAAITFQYAARRGWRDQRAQEVMLGLAMAAGDQAEATRRFAALFIGPNMRDEQLANLAQQIFTSPDSKVAHETFSEILAEADRWHSTYLRKGPRVLPAATFSQVTARATEQGARFECQPLRQAEKVIARSGEAQAIETLAQMIAATC